MEILFENQHTRDKALAKELFSYYFFKRPFYIIADVLMLALIILNIFLRNYWLIAFPLIFCFAQFFMYQQTTSAFVRQSLGENGAITVTSIITDDTVKNISPDGSESELSFDDINKVVKTKSCFILITLKGELYPLSRANFISGTEEELEKHFNSKNIKISRI